MNIDDNCKELLLLFLDSKYKIKKSENLDDEVEIRKMIAIKILKEFASYIWDEKALERGEDKPVKQHDHSCDAVRYFVSTVLGSKVARLREISR